MGTPIKSISDAGYEDLMAVLNEATQELEYIERRIAHANDIARRLRNPRLYDIDQPNRKRAEFPGMYNRRTQI